MNISCDALSRFPIACFNSFDLLNLFSTFPNCFYTFCICLCTVRVLTKIFHAFAQRQGSIHEGLNNPKRIPHTLCFPEFGISDIIFVQGKEFCVCHVMDNNWSVDIHQIKTSANEFQVICEIRVVVRVSQNKQTVSSDRRLMCFNISLQSFCCCFRQFLKKVAPERRWELLRVGTRSCFPSWKSWNTFFSMLSLLSCNLWDRYAVEPGFLMLTLNEGWYMISILLINERLWSK